MVHPGVSALGKKKSTTFLPRKSFSDTSFPFSSGKVNSGALSLTFMAESPRRSTIYRNAGCALIYAALLLSASLSPAQFAQKETRSKGPRALGLLQLAPGGKATLIPISIMVDGKFYDASAYKAAPVPMALENGTVYEAFSTGKSLGLFTVTSALTGNGRWLGAGTWLVAGSAPPSTGHKAESKPREEPEEGPPVLRKGKPKSPDDAQPPESKPAETKPADTKPADTKPAESKPATASQAPSAPPVPPAAAPAPPASEPASPPEDADRPALRRGVPPKNRGTPTKPVPPAPAARHATPAAATKPPAAASAKPNVQLVPAVSDAAGPEPRSYAYDMKPEEEQTFRKKILALAAEELRKKAQEIEPAASQAPRKRAGATKPAPPNFEDVNLRVLDVSSSNEPLLVLTAKAVLPQNAEHYITLVARSDLYGELRKLLSAITDPTHLDVTPRMEFIDAVDADGDSRAELLFREISDGGTAYAIYRVGADQLWPLYEGTPQ